jgi:hypothetical protein
LERRFWIQDDDRCFAGGLKDSRWSSWCDGRQCSLWWILWGSECDWHWKWRNGLVVTEAMFHYVNPLRKRVWLALKVTKWPSCDGGDVPFGESIEEESVTGTESDKMALLCQRRCSLWWILWGRECDWHLKWQNGLVVTEAMFPLVNHLRKRVWLALKVTKWPCCDRQCSLWWILWGNGLVVTEAMFPLVNPLRKRVWLAPNMTKWPCCDRGDVPFGESFEEASVTGT